MQTLRRSKTLSRALFSIATSSSSTLPPCSLSLWNSLSTPDCHGGTASRVFVNQRRGVRVNAIHLRPGNVIEKSGRLYQVVDAAHKQRGRGGAIMQLELRDVDTGSKQNLRFGTEEAVERVFVEEKLYTCLYTEHETAYLMDPNKFEQLEVPLNVFGDSAAYLREDMKVKLQLYDGRPLSGSVPKHVTCFIKETQLPMKGLSVTPRYKRALLDNGLTIQVPGYLDVGEKIVVDTTDNSFVHRDNK